MEEGKRYTIADYHPSEGGGDITGSAPIARKHAPTPPTSEDMEKRERSSSELSDIRDEEEEILPDHYYGGGKVPVFKPVCMTFYQMNDIVSVCSRKVSRIPDFRVAVSHMHLRKQVID